MARFGVRDSVREMHAAVASLCDKVASQSPEAAARAELLEWTEQQRAARVRRTPPPALVSSSAPATALEAWGELQLRRFDRRG